MQLCSQRGASATSRAMTSTALAPEPLAAARAELRRLFGFADFRGVQADVVARVLGGQSTLAVMPTGAGKSLTYQLPATMLDGCCVVISPLIALMHDQLRSARANGIRAATLTSVDADWRETMRAFEEGALDLLPPREAESETERLCARTTWFSRMASVRKRGSKVAS